MYIVCMHARRNNVAATNNNVHSNMVGRADPAQLRDGLVVDAETIAALEAAGSAGQLRLRYDHDQNFGVSGCPRVRE